MPHCIAATVAQHTRCGSNVVLPQRQNFPIIAAKFSHHSDRTVLQKRENYATIPQALSHLKRMLFIWNKHFFIVIFHHSLTRLIMTGPNKPEGSRGVSFSKNLKETTVLRSCDGRGCPLESQSGMAFMNRPMLGFPGA